MSLVVSAQSDLLGASDLLKALLCHGLGGSRLGVVNATFSGLRRFALCKHAVTTAEETLEWASADAVKSSFNSSTTQF